MTISEANKFYSEDKRKYDVIHNKEFLEWFIYSINDGYYPVIRLEDMQKLIDNIVNW